jgi:hypothetical protein
MIRAACLAIWLAFAGLALLCVAALNDEHKRPNAGLPIVQSDYPVCTTIAPPPLVPPKTNVFNPKLNAELS